MSNEFVKNPWTTLSGEEKYDNKWINVTEYQVINPAGGKGIYGKVSFKNIAIGIIALDSNNETYLVGQYRYTVNEFSWEIPEGGCPINELPLEAAKRELKEETGLTASRWTKLLRTHLSNSVSDEEGFVFLAEGLEQGERELEETESDLKTYKIPLRQAVEKVINGEITDGLSMMGLLMVARIKGI